jgi:HAD superfamily hydrolase (TIGR01484 family)
MKHRSIFATDFDGTLACGGEPPSEQDLNSLSRLRDSGCLVVLATGRSPFSLFRALGGVKLPVDWYVLSSGAGVMCGEGNTVLSRTLTAHQTLEVHRAFSSLGVEDTSIQGPFPDAHMLHWMDGDHGDDFHRRLSMYRGFSRKIDSAAMEASEVIGFVAPHRAVEVQEGLRSILGSGYSVVRATSPIDHSTVWMEVFAAGVNKASACGFIMNQAGIPEKTTGAVGNDWNDIDMLEWAEHPFVVGNSPDSMLKKYTVVSPCGAGGVAEAARLFMEAIE